MRCGGSHQLVDGIGSDLHSCLETEGKVGGREVVVYGLGHAHYVEPLFEQLLRYALRAVAAYAYDGIHTHKTEFAYHLFGTVHILPFTGTLVEYRPCERAALIGGLYDGAALIVYSGNRLLVEQLYLRRLPQNTVICLNTAEHLPLLVVLSRTFDYAAYHGIQSGTVAAAGRYQNPFHQLYVFFCNLAIS